MNRFKNAEFAEVEVRNLGMRPYWGGGGDPIEAMVNLMQRCVDTEVILAEVDLLNSEENDE
jgi:hypothetical protein